ncbi:MAG TPA: TIR domain-containing protein [Pyrinomonadaceae bacterium]
MSAAEYSSCLNVYVLWRPEAGAVGDDKSRGLELARVIYSTFARDINKPLNYGLGIPVFFRSVAHEGARTALPIDLERVERSAVILLVSAAMVTDLEWSAYIAELSSRTKSSNGRHRVFPVSLSRAALQFDSVLGQTNFIRYHDFADDGGQNAAELMLWLTHELCRFLNQPRSTEPGAVLSPKPIRLFISHAKQDGVPLAERFRESIADTPAAVFFDSIDIAPGYDFGAEIESHIRESTLLVLQSDVYSSRPWCRREVLMAKKLHRPIIIVNAIEEDEKRSFPYMGNVPVIRWTGKNHQRIVGLALREHLRFLYNECRIGALRRAGRIPADALVLKRPPEILDFQNIAARAAGKERHKALVIYPDPPLGAEEDMLLSAFGDDVSFTTLTMPEEKKMFSGKTIGLSISNSADLYALGFHEMHLRDALIEFTRQLLSRDAAVAYGGHLDEGGFTRILFDLVRAHNSLGAPSVYRPVDNYISWPLHLKVDDDQEAELIKVGRLHRVPLPEDLQDSGVAPNEFMEPNTTMNRYVWARCLSAMREEMNQRTDARVLMGGKLNGYTGKYPGLLEEAYLALCASKPLFLLGAFGGCTRAVVELVEGGLPEALSQNYQCSNGDYAQLVEEYNRRATARPELGLEPIDYEQVTRTFAQAGTLGLRNGLDAEQNRRLFYTVDLDEIIHLVLSGLSNLQQGK